MGSEIPFRLMGGFDGFCDSLNGSGELVQGVVDAFQAGGDAAQQLMLRVEEFLPLVLSAGLEWILRIAHG